MNKKISTSFAITVILLVGGFLTFLFIQIANQKEAVLVSLNNKHSESSQKACTQEAKQCSDGSYVSRTGPNCEFAVCSDEKNNNTSQIANPASEHCVNDEGKLEIRTNADESQTGYCVFASGKECEEWAYFRGECGKMDSSDWNIYKSNIYGYEIKLPLSWINNDKGTGIATFAVSSEKDSPVLEISTASVQDGYDIDQLIKKYLPEEVKQGRRIQKEEIMIGGEKGYYVIDCGKFECIDMKWAVVKNGKFYFLNSKNALMPEFKEMVATFRFLNK